MSKAQLVITAVVLEGRSKTEVARDYDLSRQWVHQLVTRYQTDGAAAFRRHLEGVVEPGQVFARMILRIRELWNAEIVRARLGALVDTRVEIDEVPARRAGRFQENLHIAPTVEGAGIADITVVVDDVIDVRCLGPADALEVNHERGPDRPAGDIERQRG